MSLGTWFRDSFVSDVPGDRPRGMFVAPATAAPSDSLLRSSSSDNTESQEQPPPPPASFSVEIDQELPTTAIYPSLSVVPLAVGSAPSKPVAPQPGITTTTNTFEWRETTERERAISWFTQRANILRINAIIACAIMFFVLCLAVRMYIIVRDL